LTEAPASLAAAIADRLGFLSDETAGVLRIAALLGPEFTVTDLVTVTGRGALELVPAVEEGLATGVLSESGMQLTFRHALIRQALSESVPAGLRSALHLQAAQALIAAKASMERIVEQLLATEDFVRLGGGWVLDWMVQEGPRLAYRAPLLAADLMERALEQLPVGDPYRNQLGGYLITAAWLGGRDDEVERRARQVLASTTDTAQKAQVSWTLGYTLARTGRTDEAAAVVDQALADPTIDRVWSARLQSLRVMARHQGGRYDEVEEEGEQALANAEAVGDAFAAGYALHALAQVRIKTENRPGTLAYLDRALGIIGEHADTMDLRLMLLANRAYAFEALERIPEAVAAAREAMRACERFGSRARRGVSRTMLAEILYHAGEWDDALAELDPVGSSSPYPALRVLSHGLQALIAVHRDDRSTTDRALAVAADLDLDNPEVRVNTRYVVWAQALVAERDGDPRRALDVLTTMLDPSWYDSTLSRLWLPHAVRLALDLGDTTAARDLTDVATSAASSDAVTGGLAAAERCEGLVDGDPKRVLAAAEQYRTAGRALELGNTLEDAAVLLAAAGDSTGARTALDSAAEAYTALAADWDLRRASARIRPFGLRRGPRGPHRRATSGWDALTPTENRVAAFIAEGKSNPDIATVMFLSRRTVQTHVSHILAKLGARSRVEIAAAASRHLGDSAAGTSPRASGE
jgi:DNA-binding CsgD family transcriptional regulator/tetratricopeptide (TPR) repeat protein